MEADLKLVPAKCGCEGCHYAEMDDCPSDGDKDFTACSIEGRQMIFVKKEQNDE